MIITISTYLPMPIDWVWSKLQTPNLLEYVTSPVLKFKPLKSQFLPAVWEEETYEVNLFFLHLIPLGKQSIVISKDSNQTWLLDSGFGDLAKKWEHLITLQAVNSNNTKYTDKVEIEAGFLTPLIWVFALFFYRYRQFRWQRLIQTQD